MSRAVLVIGSVSAEQYARALSELMRQNKELRVGSVAFREFFLHLEELIDKYAPGGRRSVEGMDGAELDKFGDELAKRHLNGYGKIAAVIMDEQSWSDCQEYAYITDALMYREIYVWYMQNGRLHLAEE